MNAKKPPPPPSAAIEDRVLARMLAMPPDPKVALKAKKRAKKQEK